MHRGYAGFEIGGDVWGQRMPAEKRQEKKYTKGNRLHLPTWTTTQMTSTGLQSSPRARIRTEINGDLDTERCCLYLQEWKLGTVSSY